MVHLDFETRSPADLPLVGAYNYARHGETEVLCLGWATDDMAVPLVWTPLHGALPDKLVAAIRRGDEVVAHNAEFERLIWRHCFPNAPRIRDEQWRCSAVVARAAGLPGALGDATFALGLPKEKQKLQAGRALVKACCTPPYDTSEAALNQLYEYCRQDVVAERELWNALPKSVCWPEYQAHLAINDRGLLIDREWAFQAVAYAKQETDEINERLRLLTNGRVTSARQYARLRKELWVEFSLDRRARQVLLSDPKLSVYRRELLELTDAASRSSVAKYQAMLNRSGGDGRVRGAYMFNGASTGRFSSYGLQLHNFPRKTHPDPDTVAEQGIPEGARVMDTLAQMLRPTIIAAEDKVLVWGDWSAIEARALPWLAGDPAAGRVLDIFRDPTRDIYQETAGSFGGDRQEGKVAVLSMGYGGGVGAFQNMARNYGVLVDDVRADAIKTGWRCDNAWAVRFWRGLEQAALRAYYSPGVAFEAGRVRYQYEPSIAGGALFCELPSGRLLCYPQLRMENDELSCVKAGLDPAADAKEWPRMTLWGGLMAENVTQATCADLLRAALLLVQHHCVGHVHDELILEVPEEDRAYAVRELREVMEVRGKPAWAEGLPLKADVKWGYCYTK